MDEEVISGSTEEKQIERSLSSRRWMWVAIGGVVTALLLGGLFLYVNPLAWSLHHPDEPSSPLAEPPVNSTPSPTTTLVSPSPPSPSPSLSSSGPPQRDQYVVLTDLHYDPLYSTSAHPKDYCRVLVGPTTEDDDGKEESFARTCVDDSDFKREVKHGHYEWGSYGCDAPSSLVHSLFQHLLTFDKKPAFLLILGDSVAHCTYSQEHLLLIHQSVADLIRSYLPTTPVYFALGNNDVYPHNALPLGPSELLTSIADSWWHHGLLSDEGRNTFSQGGYYADSPTDHVRVVSLNTIYYYQKWKATNGSHPKPPEEYEADPLGQFAWLEAQLIDAREQGQGVIVIGHVGPTCSHSMNVLWFDQYTDTFSQIVKRHQDVIKGLYFSHIHRDMFTPMFQWDNGTRFASSYPGELPPSEVVSVGTVVIPPAVSPNTRQNPAYRWVEFDEESGEALDYEQYYFPLHESHLPEGTFNGTIDWLPEYRFSRTWNLPDLSPSSYRRLYRILMTNHSAWEQWKQLRVTGSDYTNDYEKLTDDEVACSIGGLCNDLAPCSDIAQSYS